MEPHVVLSSENRPNRGQIGPISLIAYTQLIGVTSHFTPFTHVVLSCGNRPNRGQMSPISLIACAQLIGVTSHFTPLPMGEGKGEGPAVDWSWATSFILFSLLFGQEKGILPQQYPLVKILLAKFIGTDDRRLSRCIYRLLIKNHRLPDVPSQRMHRGRPLHGG